MALTADRTSSGSADGELAAIVVRSDRSIDGVFHVSIAYTDDLLAAFTRAQAIAYAVAVVDAVARAEFDVAVALQLVDAGGSTVPQVGEQVRSLRSDRAPLDVDALGLLQLRPGICEFTGAPYLHCQVRGQAEWWRWTPAEAEKHAMDVLHSATTVALDEGYRRHLVTVVGMDTSAALTLVAMLGECRPPRPPGAVPDVAPVDG